MVVHKVEEQVLHGPRTLVDCVITDNRVMGCCVITGGGPTSEGFECNVPCSGMVPMRISVFSFIVVYSVST